MGGTACAAMNAANEAAVALFLQEKIGFYDISDAVQAAMEAPVILNPNLEQILEADHAARELVQKMF